MVGFEKPSAEFGNSLNGDTNGTEAVESTVPIRDEEKYKAAREAGWVQPQAYNYDAAMAKHGDTAQQSTTEKIDVEDMPGWMHTAVKYEWREEYGDVGPEVSDLEAQLFKNDSRTRTGQFLDR